MKRVVSFSSCRAGVVVASSGASLFALDVLCIVRRAGVIAGLVDLGCAGISKSTFHFGVFTFVMVVMVTMVVVLLMMIVLVMVLVVVVVVLMMMMMMMMMMVMIPTMGFVWTVSRCVLPASS